MRTAFVVQFSIHPVTDQAFSGRVEHVISGKATHFNDVGEFRAFVNKVVAEEGMNDAEVTDDFGRTGQKAS